MPVLPLVLACGSDNLKPEPGDPSKAFWELELNHHAAMLSLTPPYDTLTLVATPRNYKGEPLTGLPAPRYTSRVFDQALVTDGVLRVLKVGSSPIWVVATVTTGDRTQSDSIQVRVVNNAAPPVLTSFSVHPVPPDTAKVGTSSGGGLPSSAILPVQAADANGVPITGLPVYFRSSDPTTATIGRANGTVQGLRNGTVTFYASTTAFGVTKTDEVLYRIGWPLSARVQIRRVMPIGGSNPVFTFSPSEVKVGVGAAIEWQRTWSPSVDGRAVDITFADAKLLNVEPGSPSYFYPVPFLCDLLFGFAPNDCINAGNIAFTTETYVVRTLTAPGTYDYTSTGLGVGGRIAVMED